MELDKYCFTSRSVVVPVFLFLITSIAIFAGNSSYDNLVEINDKVQVNFSNFYQDRSKGQTRCNVVITNTSTKPIRFPVVLTFASLPDDVSVIEDGLFTDGTKYIDFTGQIQDSLFLPGASTASKIISFSNPTYKKLTPTWSAWSAPDLFAKAIATPTEGNAPLNVDFTAQYNGDIVLFEWDFDGDGIFDWSDPATPDTTFLYQRAGSFNAIIRITEDTGLTATDSVAVTVESSKCIILREEHNFTISAAVDFTIHQMDSSLSFIIDKLEFDTTDQDSINDAFEAILLDENGQILSFPHYNDCDSFLNITEGLSLLAGPDVKLEGEKIILNLKTLNPGTNFKIKFRLVNNDSDTQSWVCIRDLQIESGGQVTPIPTGNANYLVSEANRANTNADDRIDLLDLAVMASNWGRSVLGGKLYGDLDNNGIVNLTDLAAMALYWCYTVPIFSSELSMQSFTLPLETKNTPQNLLDFARLSDISPSISAQYGRTSLNDKTSILYAQLDLINAGTYGIGKPLILIIDHLSDPSIRVVGADGSTPDGRPYYSLGGKLSGSIFNPNDTINIGYIAFYNPNFIQFSYTLTVLGMLNHSPEFTSSPIIEALVGKDYKYDANATDSDEDTLTYSLSSSPAGMTVNPATGLITWKPVAKDIGNQSVIVRVEDGHGGCDAQSYQISVRDYVPNRPPVFTSSPVVESSVGVVYRYDADAIDPDQDPIIHLLIQGPDDMTINPTTGEVLWAPTIDDIYDNDQKESLGLGEIAGCIMEVYAGVKGPQWMSWSPEGVLFTGRQIDGGDGLTPAKIIRISERAVKVEEYGDVALPDPDFVAYDATGCISGTPGSVLVGGNEVTGSAGRISAILPDGSVITIVGPDINVGNVNDLFIDSRGRLIWHNETTGYVGCLSKGMKTHLFTTVISSDAKMIEDPSGNILVSTNDGVIRKYSCDGVLVDNAVLTGLGKSVVLAFGQGGYWGRDLYMLDRSGTLLRVSGDRTVKSIGYDLPSRYISFGPDNALYLSHFMGDQILRIRPTKESLGLASNQHPVTIAASDHRGGIAYQSFNVIINPQLGNNPPVIISDPVTTLLPGHAYQYDVEAIDPDGDVLNNSLLKCPDGMTIDPVTGMISWTNYDHPVPELDFAFLFPVSSECSEAPGRSVTDAEGNIYMAGQFSGTVDFDPGPEIYNLYGSSVTGFVAKYDKQRNLIWAKITGNNPYDMGLDQWGNVYVVCPDIRKYSNDGDLIWTRFAGTIYGLAFDNQGNVVTVGQFSGTVDFDPGPEKFELTSAGSEDCFVWKLDKDGKFVWACRMGETNNDPGYDIATDPFGNVYVVGNMTGVNVDFDPGPGEYLLSTYGGGDAFVWKLDSGGDFVWAGLIGGPGIDQGQGAITVDNECNVYVTGQISGTADLDPSLGTYMVNGYGGYDIFVCKLNSEGNLIWGHIVGSENHDIGYGIAVDYFGNVYVAGIFSNTVDFNPGPGVDNLNSEGRYDGFLWKLDREGNHLLGRRIGGSERNDVIHDVSINNSNGILTIHGAFYNTSIDVDLGPNVYQLRTASYAGFNAVYNTLKLPADVTVQVADSRGGTDLQSFTITASTETPSDLTISDIGTQNIATDPQTLRTTGTITAKVTNSGTITISKPFDVLFFDDCNYNGLFDSVTDSILAITTVSKPLSVGQSITVTALANGIVSFPGNFVYGFVDSTNTIYETNENDNIGRNENECIFAPQIGQFNPVVKYQSLVGPVNATPMIVNLTDDNGDSNVDDKDIPDIVFAAMPNGQANGGPVIALSGDNGNILFKTGLPNQVASYGELAVGDIDGDGLPEIVGAYQPGNRLIAFENTGAFKWFSDIDVLPGRYDSGGAISIANIDGNGNPEIIVGSSVYSAQGKLLADGRDLGGTIGFHNWTAVSCVADIDLEGNLEIVAGPTAYRYYDNKMTKVWSRTDRGDGFAGIANFDSDPFAEIVIVSNGTVYMLNHDGTNAEVWNPPTFAPVALPGGGSGGVPTIGDYDGDGMPEIGIAGRSRYVVFKSNGTVLWTSVNQDYSSGTTGSTTFDFEGDGIAEVIYRDERYLRIYSGPTGNILYQIPMGSFTGTEMPVVADVDNDGNAEIIVGSDGYGGNNIPGVYVIGDKNDTWAPARGIWNQHSYHVTNINGDGTIPIHEENSWQAHNTYRCNISPIPSSPQAAPNLNVSYVRYQKSDENSEFLIRIGNSGEILAPANIWISFYNGNPHGGGIFLDRTKTTISLDPGHYEDVSITLPSAVKDNLWIWGDDDGTGKGQVSECNEEDNSYHPDFKTIPAGNNPPVFISTPFTSATTEQSYYYNAQALDPDSDSLIFDMPAGKPEGMAIDSVKGIIAWTPKINQIGSHDIVLRVSDGQGGIDLQCFQIIVSNANSIPVIISEPLRTATEGIRYAYSVTAQDADGDILSYSLAISPNGMTIDPSSGHINWIPDVSQVGLHQVDIVATDGKGGQALQSFEITVASTSVNEPPMIASTPRQITVVNELYLYPAQATDSNGDVLTYNLQVSPIGMTINADNGLVQWTPTVEQFGSNTVRINVQDGRGGLAYQEFDINVVMRAVNNAPSITSKPVFNAALGQIYAYDAEAKDADNDPLFWSLDAAPIGMSVDANRGTIRWTPIAGQTGSHQVVLRVMDSLGDWATQTYSINVNSLNTPPNITSNPSTEAYVEYPYTYSVIAADPEGDLLTYSLVASPAGMTISSSSGLITWTANSGQVGLQSVEIKAEDSKGVYCTQSYNIEVSTGTPNNPPIITSTPKSFALAETLYQYQVQATDPELEVITYSLEVAPAGMTIDSSTGLIDWTPTISQVGDNIIKIAANTSQHTAFQSFAIQVVGTGNFPVITSTPQGYAMAGLLWSYDVIAHDPDNDALNYILTVYPDGMTMDQYGRIRWTPQVADIGMHNVTIQVMDTYGLIAEQSLNLAVVVDTTKPTISLVLSQNPVMLGSQYTMTAWAADNVTVTSMVVTLAGSPVILNSNGQATLTADSIGSFEIVMTAADAAGNISSGSMTLYVLYPNPDPNPPVVHITSPQQDDIITNITDIIGSVQDDNLLYYTLSVARADDIGFTEIARSTSTVENGQLGSFDPTVLANDTYILKLTAVDAANNTSYAMIDVGVQGDLKLGNFTLSFTDLSIPVSGIPITVTRTYDSLNANRQQDLGYGWRLELKDTDLRTSVPKTGYEEEVGYFNAFYYGAKVYVTTPDGKRQGFTFIPSPPRGWGEQFLGIWHPAFVPDAGVTSQLAVLDTYLQYVEDTGEFYFYDAWAYNPADTELGDGMYILTTADGISYKINGMTGDLQVISDSNGNNLTFTEDAVISSTGPRVQIQRDAYGRITAVIDPAGNRVQYGYNNKGDLINVTDREDNVTQFIYRDDRPHYLDQIIDPLGRTGVRTEYDDKGRLIAMVDANGNTVGLDHDPSNFTETVTDTLGNKKIYVYDDRGNVVTEVDALGGTITRTYDNNNYLLTETDPLGNTTTYTRDNKGNPLTVTDPLGNTTRYTYGPLNTLLTTTDPLGNTTTNAYDSKGNLLSTIDAIGNVTTYTYDPAGNQTSVTDAMGNVTQFTYDSSGNMISQTNALGHTTTYTYDSNGNQLTQTSTVTTASGLKTQITTNTYDANGRVITVTDAKGNVRYTEYNAIGKMSATIDALGRRTEYVYDQRGLLIETILPDDSPENLSDNARTRTEYDAAGRAVAQIDALGRKTISVYDAAGRIVETIFPDDTPDDLTDNPRTRTGYNLAGQTIAQIDQRGNRTEFEYDAAGRQILVRNALGQETKTTYDAAGRSIKQTDALGHTTRFEYDALGRVVRTVFADGTSTSTGYDALGRAIDQTNQLGITTHYEYDALGHLTAVIDALGGRTEYGYDESGNQITQTDALGRVTRFEYDILGQRTASILPMGQRSSSIYDAAGNVISTTDFNGAAITYVYDARNQLMTKHLPDGSATQFAYTLLGQRQTITDNRGVTTFAYDVNNRLISRTDPDGASVQYTYDLAGNRTSTASLSGTIFYTFDALNRQSTVMDPDGGLTRYTYNTVGNLIRTDLPNGTFETRSYDVLNRLVYLESRSAAGVILSFQYTLDAAGNRIAVVENTGRRTEYVYDALSRLVSESVTDAVNGNRFVSYTFDAVGNRLSRNDLANGLTTYAYDNNDRLLFETIGIQTTTYTYDNNGNTLSRMAGPLDNATYSWNAENRLIAADVVNAAGSKHMDYQYDTDGIRIASAVDGDQTRYLIDVSQPYQQVLEEYAPGFMVKASYVHGLDLISQKRDTARYFYHVDGLGSARTLTNSAGVVTDSYLYDAYGQIISQTGSTPNSYLFAGEQRDFNLGLDYLRARYMNPSLGRFYGMDSFSGLINSPISLNKYIYGNANPIANIDPTGRITITDVTFTIHLLNTGLIMDCPTSPTYLKRFNADSVIDACKENIASWSNDCSGFVRAVAKSLKIGTFPGTPLADTIMDIIRTDGRWAYFGSNVQAATTAANLGYFVVGGLKSIEMIRPPDPPNHFTDYNDSHGHVVVVVSSSDLKHGKYPKAFWGTYPNGPGSGGKGDWITKTFHKDNDDKYDHLDKVTYAAIKIY